MEFALSSQHVSRVTKALRNGWGGVTQSVIYFLDDLRNMDLVKKGHKFLEVGRSFHSGQWFLNCIHLVTRFSCFVPGCESITQKCSC